VKDKRILVLSRNPAMVGSLKDNLPAPGYQIVCSEAFAEDLKGVIQAVQPDIVLVDIAAPGMRGIEVSLRVRQITPVPVLMLSNSQTTKGRIRRLDLGTESRLSKPISFDDLVKRIEEATS
jgi:two-component system KDP operon response regulator KdpE